MPAASLVDVCYSSNTTRKDFIAQDILKKLAGRNSDSVLSPDVSQSSILSPGVIGIYRLVMKAGSDNFRAVIAGARRAKACAELEISDRTLRRWTRDGQIHADQRPLVPRPEPANKLSVEERAAVLDICNSEAFDSLPPSQIVPNLADQGQYLASEPSFYGILRAEGQQHHRGRARPAGPAQTAHQLQGERPLRGLDLGHYMDARTRRGHVLLPLPHHGHLQP